MAERTAEAFTAAAERVLAADTRSNGREVITRTLSLEAVASRVLAVYAQARDRHRHHTHPTGTH